MKPLITIIIIIIGYLCHASARDLTYYDAKKGKTETLKDINIYRVYDKKIYVSHSKGVKMLTYEELNDKDKEIFYFKTFKDNDSRTQEMSYIIALDIDGVYIKKPILKFGRNVIKISWNNVSKDIKESLGYGAEIYNNAGVNFQLKNNYTELWLIKISLNDR